MKFKELDVVTLLRDLPEHGLLRGNSGTIVFVHDADNFEVEFLFTSGDTAAVIEVTSSELRPATSDDNLAVPDRPATALEA